MLPTEQDSLGWDRSAGPGYRARSTKRKYDVIDEIWLEHYDVLIVNILKSIIIRVLTCLMVIAGFQPSSSFKIDKHTVPEG